MTLRKSLRHIGVVLFVLAFASVKMGAVSAQTKKRDANSATAQSSEKKGDHQLAAAKTNPLQLRQFLKKMPKGADLHYHLSGGVYAESFIRDAAEDGLCVDVKKLAFAKCSSGADEEKNVVPAATVYRNQSLYDQLINSFSMRSFVPYAGVSGHDHFFETFAKFGGTNASHKPEWVDE